MTKLRVAVVGAGHLGLIHARLLKAMRDVELVAVADPAVEARARVTGELGVPVETNYESLLGRIDAAVLAAPTRWHHAIGMKLIAHGIHLLVEKPICATLREAEELTVAARRAGAALQVGHVEEFNPAFTAARPHLAAPKFIDAVRTGGFTFRSTDVGVVLDLMIHDLDLVLALAGVQPCRVQAMGIALFGRHEDVVHAQLEFPNGLVAHFAASRASREPRRTMQVWSEHGFTHIDFAQRTASLVQPSEAVLRRELDVETFSASQVAAAKEGWLDEHLPVKSLPVVQNNAIGDELSDFIEAISLGRAPRVDGARACQALAVAEKILAAMAKHAWEPGAGGRRGPSAVPRSTVLRGPHWLSLPETAPIRDAG